MKIINNVIKISENNYAQNDKFVVTYILNALSAKDKGEFVAMGNIINKFNEAKDNEEIELEITEVELIKKKLSEAIEKNIFTQKDDQGNSIQIAPKTFIIKTILYYDGLK